MESAADHVVDLVIRTIWHNERDTGADAPTLRGALAYARRNDAESHLIRAYAHALPGDHAALELAVGRYRQNLADASQLLAAARLRPILIKALPTDDFTYSNFDIVVGADGYDAAREVLSGWASRTSVYPLERATKALFYPPTGPAVHLHREVAWFDIPAVPTDRVRADAWRPAGSPCEVPSPTVALEILLAHAVFQNQAIPLGDLLAYRTLAMEADLASARTSADRQGWGRGFDDARRVAERAIERLDAGVAPMLPSPLPSASALIGGIAHAAFLARTGRPVAAMREVVLRGPLVVAKRRALRAA